MNKYRTHMFVFLVTLFIGLTFAHPAILLNDEFITTNQLRQLHAGHQVVINEGKYGLFENGTMSRYFAHKSNILAYSLFLPIISLPAHWIIDISGEHFVYLILCLWILISLMIVLFINHFYPSFSFFGQRKWTPFAIITIFLSFFINLFFYSAFPIDLQSNYPEVIAIVFTNVFLLALVGMLIYEINRSIFEDLEYSFFGTFVCLFSSSYFFWVTHCKDHILVLLVFSVVFLCLVRFYKTEEYWYLPLSFISTGLLIWIRPEIAFWCFLLICGVCGYTLYRYTSQKITNPALIGIFLSPLFTIIGALPFFLNNYMVTKNFLLPVQTLYLSPGSTLGITNHTQPLDQNAGPNSILTIIMMFLPKIPSSFQEFLDFLGIFFYPQTGSISIFALIPLFLTMMIVAGFLILFKKIQFSKKERVYLFLSLLVSFIVFLTYASLIHLMNVDPGIIPDIRYLSPMYLPLTIASLIVLKKINILPEKPENTIRYLVILSTVGLISSIILLPFAYRSLITVDNSDVRISVFFSIYTLSIIFLSIAVILYSVFWKQKNSAVQYLVLLLCSIPFFWQGNIIILTRIFSGFAGYTFWIPVVRVFWEFITKSIMLKNFLP